MDNKSIGKKLRQYRAQRGWSVSECAERCGISTRYLTDIERGYKVPKLETFVHILNTLTASADDVLQNSLVVGYRAASNDIIKKLDVLEPTKRQQALDIFSSIIDSLKN